MTVRVAVLGRVDARPPVAGSVSRTACGASAEGRMDRGGILALAHRGVAHVRGKDCVHPDIGFVIVTMISFPARESGQRARMAVPGHGRERSSS